MAEMKGSSLVELKKECQIIIELQKRITNLCKRRRNRLTHLFFREYFTFHVSLQKFPTLTSKTAKKNYGEFKRSYDLFCVQIENALSVLKTPANIGFINASPTKQIIKIWEDYRDDLQDALKENVHILNQYEKDGFLALLQILDTTDRMQSYFFLNIEARSNVYQRALEELHELTVQIRQVILLCLSRRTIYEIPLLPGSYPSISTTRIISREDNQTTDDIVISRVAEKGYTWGNTILRKAAVVVITRS
jgi:molecular chaperone GrpE (heat shock protein)